MQQRYMYEHQMMKTQCSVILFWMSLCHNAFIQYWLRSGSVDTCHSWVQAQSKAPVGSLSKKLYS